MVIQMDNEFLTEDITEEVTEETQLDRIEEGVRLLVEQSTENVTSELETIEGSELLEENTTEVSEEETTTEGVIVDEHLYMSKEYTDKDINDVYSMALSIRNIVLLFVLVVLCWKGFAIMKNIVYRVMNW